MPPLVNSDHDTVLCHLQQMTEHRPSTPVRLVRCYNDADYSATAQSLSKCQWRHIYARCISIDGYWTALNKLLNELAEKFVPMRAVRQDDGRASAIGKCPRLPKTVRRFLLLKRRVWRQ